MSRVEHDAGTGQRYRVVRIMGAWAYFCCPYHNMLWLLKSPVKGLSQDRTRTSPMLCGRAPRSYLTQVHSVEKLLQIGGSA